MPPPRFPRRALLAVAIAAACARPEPGASGVVLPPDLDRMDLPVRQQFLDAAERLRILEKAAAAPAARAEAQGRMGMVFQAYGYNESAARCYEEAAQRAPEEFRWPYLRATVERYNGRWPEAEAAMRRALELRPNYPAARVTLAAILTSQGRIDEAEELLVRQTADDPAYAPAWIGLAKVALARREPRAALDLLREAEVRRPDSSEVQYLLGQAHAALGDLAAAARHFASLPERNLFYSTTGLEDPILREMNELRDGSLERVRAGAVSSTRSLSVALLELEQALASNPDIIQPRFTRARLLYEAGNLEAAQAELGILLGRVPNHELGLRLEGAIAEDRGDLVEADRLYQRALAVNPVAAENLMLLANLERRTGRLDAASGRYAQAAELDPGLAAAHFWRAALLLAAGRREEALAVIGRAHRALPEDRALALLAGRLDADASWKPSEEFLTLAAPPSEDSTR